MSDHDVRRHDEPAGGVQPDTRSADTDAVVIPVVSEALRVEKQDVVTGGVRVRKHVIDREETIDERLWREELHLERVPVGRFVDAVPEPRSEGDLTVVPVVEEVAVIEKRLWLREELHIR